MCKSYQKEYRDNITDEQEQKRREAIRQYQKKYRDNMTDEQKQKRRETNRRYQKKYRDNMSDEQKQKQRDYQIDYRKKYYGAKKLNKIINYNDNKIIDDNDNDFYCMSIIIKLKKNIIPIKDIVSILKINKKVCSQVYLKECDFINDGYNNFLDQNQWSVLAHIGFSSLKL